MKGFLLIPDISGFTSFVNQVDAATGMAVISDLLSVIIDHNPLPVELSEIEGDALLFYRVEAPLPLHTIFAGTHRMQQAFDDRFQQLKSMHHLDASLSLKFIVHYGELNVYGIKGFRKLYGPSVIESHCLLKNGEGKSHYVLITDDYRLAITESEKESSFFAPAKSYSRNFEGLRRIDYSFYDCAALPIPV